VGDGSPHQKCRPSADLLVCSAGIVISIDPFTARNPSYCFVDFLTEEEAQRALTELDGKLLLKREVKTRPATRPGQVPKKYQPSKFRPSRPEWVDPSGTTAPGETPWVFDRWKKDGMDVLQHNFPAQGCRLFVGNLPGFNLHPPTVQTNIKALFASQGFEP
jgi:RNA recognition motif-containing protein